MNPTFALLSVVVAVVSFDRTFAQPAPLFSNAQRLANQEVRFSLNVTTNTNYRVEVSTNLLDWQPVVTWRGVGVNQHTDSAAPYFETRYYRAQQLTTTNDLTGDQQLGTASGIEVRLRSWY
jgi:hypothetical protein